MIECVVVIRPALERRAPTRQLAPTYLPLHCTEPCRCSLQSVSAMWSAALLALAAVSGCAGDPCAGTEGVGGEKAPGDNHYRLLVNGDVERYRPDQRYVITLVGSRTHSVVQSFSGFTIWLDPLDPAMKPSPARVGQFQLFADTLTKFSDTCSRAVTQADDLPKTEVQVMWKAPPAGAGCVNIKATVFENGTRWFSEDGQLTRRLCEDKAYSASQCCACDTAHYKMVFSGLWSAETHPKDFPTRALWLTHFSDVIGAVHQGNFSFWGEGEIASDGFRSLAEWGSPGLLERELVQRGRGGALRSVVKAPGLWHPNVNGNTSATFSTDPKRHLLSVASMFGPSPDWVVGVSGLSLCLPDCTWEGHKEIDLYPYDAGTDSGISYMSPNVETRPREKMYRITEMYPEDPRAPFYAPGGSIAPLARLTITRERLEPHACDEEALQALVDLQTDDHMADRPECAVSPWSAWSACSVSCGKGLRTRSRRYLQPEAALRARCDRQLTAKEMCVADVPECPQDVAAPSPAVSADSADGMCAVSEWGEWGQCSVTCGAGQEVRRRTFQDRMAAKKCPLVNIEESRKCMLEACPSEEPSNPACPTSEWGAWSPCSASCGKGAHYRSRLLLVPVDMQRECAANVTLVQQETCNEHDCVIDMATAKRICMEEADPGPCRGEFTRWTFVAMKGMCIPFPYGGCRGNRNNFHTQRECTDTCQPLLGAGGGPLGGALAVGADVQGNTLTGSKRPEPSPLDCVTSPWSEWSRCSVTCGIGYQERTRAVLREASEGGAPCPARLSRRRRCSRRC